MQQRTAQLWRALGSLQGKLTLSYVFVTVLATIILEVLLLAVLGFFFTRSNFIPNALATLASQVAGDLQGALLTPERSDEVLGRTYTDPFDGAEGGITIQATTDDGQVGDTLLAVIDRNGRVVSGSPALGYTRGEQFTARAHPVEQRLLEQALRGTTDVSQLGDWLEPAQLPVAAHPIFAADGTVSGAIFIRAREPLGLPTLGEFATLIGISAVGLTVAAALTGTLFGFFTAWPFTRRLGRLAAANAALAAGALDARVDDCASDEIGALGRQFNTMAEQLETSVRSLKLLAERNALLAEQAHQLAVVEERNRLARDLHDSVSQQLFSITMLAAAARELVVHNPQQAAQHLAGLQQAAQQALHETRSLIHELRPAALNSQGLGPALRQYVQEFRNREGLAVELHVADERRLPLAHELALFRIVQEALANVARHAHASSVALQLWHEPGQVVLRVADNGQGFDPQHPPRTGGVGMGSMAERARELGGQLTIASRPGQGTTITATLPVLDDIASPPLPPIKPVMLETANA
jgi:two-component system, NarL family, sensor histidine kinase LiaS